MAIQEYSPLKYPNSKKYLVPFFELLCDKCEPPCDYFIEPFGGGCEVGLNLLVNKKVKRLYINDYDRGVASVWNTIIENPKWLTQTIRHTDVTLEEWYRQREYVQTHDEISHKMGFATLFLNRTSVGGYLNGNPIGGYYGDTKKTIENAFNKMDVGLKIRLLTRYKKQLTSNDYDIKYWNQRCVQLIRNKVLIFYDPPCQKNEAVSLFSWSLSDHKEFIDSLRYVPNGRRWVITIDQNKEIYDLYHSAFEIHTYHTQREDRDIGIIYSHKELIPTQRELDDRETGLTIA